jgi:RND family efflux transporter MFP subunit
LAQTPSGSHPVNADRPQESARSANDLWTTLAGAHGSREFCSAWLGLLGRSTPGATLAMVLMRQPDGSFAPAAIWPEPASDVSGLVPVAERCLKERRGIVEPSAGPAVPARVAYPFEAGGMLQGATVAELGALAAERLPDAVRAIYWGAGWLESLAYRLGSAADAARVEQASVALNVLATATQARGAREAATAVATDLAGRLGCDRVMIGLRRRHSVRLLAISHSAWFDRKTQLVAAAENAMDEAIDQGASVVLPPSGESLRLSAAHSSFAAETGAAAVVSVVMPVPNGAGGAITCERRDGPPFDAGTLALLDAVAALLGPVLDQQRSLDRWFAGKVRDRLGRWWTSLTDRRHPSFKLAVAGSVALVGAVAFVPTDYNVPAKAVIEGLVLRAAAAPFAGYIAEARVRAGDTVSQGQVLAVLDDRDLRLEQAKWRSELEQALGKYRSALAGKDRAGARVTASQADQAQAQLSLAEERLRRTQLVAPFDGVVVSGDLAQLLGSPVEQGKVLFEIAPLDAYRVILQVDERDVRFVRDGQTGRLALTGQAAERLRFEVIKVTPVSSQAEGRNFFRVEARLQDADPTLRPGMEGVGKIHVGERSLLWIWKHQLIDWLTLALWRWLP